MPTLKVVVAALPGGMGRPFCGAVESAEEMDLGGPQRTRALDTSVTDVLSRGEADILVDFTTPEAAPANVIEAIEGGVHAVVGSTGFDLEELRVKVLGAEDEGKCFVAPNFAIGRC
jgi:4-hydroxy-tetrahydrodipicolinate reductase